MTTDNDHILGRMVRKNEVRSRRLEVRGRVELRCSFTRQFGFEIGHLCAHVNSHFSYTGDPLIHKMCTPRAFSKPTTTRISGLFIRRTAIWQDNGCGCSEQKRGRVFASYFCEVASLLLVPLQWHAKC